MELLRKRGVTGSVVCLAAMQWAAIGFSVYLMLYAQQVLELEPLAAGLLLLASGLGPPLFSSLAGWLTDRGMAAWLVVGGLAVAALALIFTASGVQRYQDVLLIPLFFVFGTAAAFVYTPSSASTMIAAPEAEEGVVAGLTMQARQIGSVVGITATSAVLVAVEWRMRDALLLGPDAYFSAEQRHALDGLLSDSETGNRLLNSLPPGATAERGRGGQGGLRDGAGDGAAGQRGTAGARRDAGIRVATPRVAADRAARAGRS